MAFDGTTDCWWPSLPIGVHKQPRLNIAQFGDGYEQRILDGINTAILRFRVTFDGRPSSVILAMDAFLEARKGSSFDFKYPVDGVVYKVFCDEWEIDWYFRKWSGSPKVASFRGTLSAEFRRAFGVQV